MSARQTSFQAIGTQWDIKVSDEINQSTWTELLGATQARIASFDQTYSRFRNDSLITRMSLAAGEYDLPADGYKMLDFYQRLYKATAGKVTPLIGQTMSDSGYDAVYSFDQKTMQPPPPWQEVIKYTKTKLTISLPCLLDFGAAGKGYLVDILGESFDQVGLDDYSINAGGDILQRTSTGELLAVGLENPNDSTEAIGVAKLSNRSLCASAGSKRKWGNFHHIIDPNSLLSPKEIIATWVIAEDTMTADGLATALFFTAPEQLAKHFSFSYAYLDKNMQLSRSKDFPATIFSADQA